VSSSVVYHNIIICLPHIYRVVLFKKMEIKIIEDNNFALIFISFSSFELSIINFSYINL
jgi:hypothetical protein